MPSRRTSLPARGSASTPIIDRLTSSSQTHSPHSPSGRSRSTRSVSRQPTVTGDEHPHHLSAADEQALLEAEKILSTPTRRLRSADKNTPDSVAAASLARDRRHLHLLEAREKEEHSERMSVGTHDAAEEEDAGLASATLDLDDSDDDNTNDSGVVILGERIYSDDEKDAKSRSAGGNRNDQASKAGKSSHGNTKSVRDEEDSDAGTISKLDAADEAETSMTLNETEGPTGAANQQEADEDEERSDSEADQSSSDSESSDSDSEDDSETSASEEDSDEEDERLEKLLQAAKISAIAKQKGKGSEKGEQNGEVVLQFDEAEKQEAPIPDINVPTLPLPHLSFGEDGRARATPSEATLLAKKSTKAQGKQKAVAAELDNRPYEKEVSKRQKAKQPKKASESELWATLPTARRDALPQMKRDYQALALANSLDPKRFMKGGTKLTKVPETFAIGTMVEQPKHLQATTLTREVKYKPGQIVQNIVEDEGLGYTAKRKYGDLQSKRMDNGRGKGWKKRAKW